MTVRGVDVAAMTRVNVLDLRPSFALLEVDRVVTVPGSSGLRSRACRMTPLGSCRLTRTAA